MLRDIPESSGVAEGLRQRSGLPGVHLGGAIRALIAVVSEESQLHYDTISQHFTLLTVSPCILTFKLSCLQRRNGVTSLHDGAKFQMKDLHKWGRIW